MDAEPRRPLVEIDRRQFLALALLLGLASLLSLVRYAVKGGGRPPAESLQQAPADLVYPEDEYRARTPRAAK